jgi:hypothetical protein
MSLKAWTTTSLKNLAATPLPGGPKQRGCVCCSTESNMDGAGTPAKRDDVEPCPRRVSPGSQFA